MKGRGKPKAWFSGSNKRGAAADVKQESKSKVNQAFCLSVGSFSFALPIHHPPSTSTTNTHHESFLPSFLPLPQPRSPGRNGNGNLRRMASGCCVQCVDSQSASPYRPAHSAIPPYSSAIRRKCYGWCYGVNQWNSSGVVYIMHTSHSSNPPPQPISGWLWGWGKWHVLPK